MIPLLMKVLTMHVLYPLLPPSEKVTHWIIVLGDAIRISKYDVNGDVSMALPESTN